MNRKRNAVCGGTLAATFVALAVQFLPSFIHGEDGRPAQPAGKLVVHEWGTFTSFSGSNGINLEYRPLATNDLPPFIMTPFNQPGITSKVFAKQAYIALQRMETPVTYFYTDAPRTVNVRVDFPDGMLTEWFPPIKQFEPPQVSLDRIVSSLAFLDWGSVKLTPANQFENIRMRGFDGGPVAAALLPVAQENHYGRARETDSAIVETVDAKGGSHFEKFLFYRGIGNFQLPLKLVALGGDRFEVTNSGDTDTGVMFLVRIDEGRVRFSRHEPAKAGTSVEFTLPSENSTVDDLAADMVRGLTATGLYEKEALAMVNTWRTSWFGESGTRLLYVVPEKLTEGLMPLTIEPAPDERVRILVGRLETLTPEDCQRLIVALVGDDPNKALPDSAIKIELATLSRFAEPAIQYLIAQSSDPPAKVRLELILANIRNGK